MRRALQRLGLVLVVLLVLVVALVVGAWAWLHSPAGAAVLTAQARAAAADALAGKVTLGRVALDGERLVLEDLVLATPEGEVVARVKRLTAEVELAALLRRVVHLRQVRVEGPELLLRQDERGLNLTRALAARHPSPAQAASSLHVDVDAVALEQGALSFTSGEQHVALEALAATGQATVDTNPLRVASTLTLTAQLTAPRAEAVSLQLETTSPRGDAFLVKLAAALGSTAMAGTLAWPEAELQGLTLTATPEVLTAFVPAWPLRVPLTAQGDLGLAGGHLDVRAGAGVAVLSGEWDATRQAVKALDLQVHDLDLSEVLEGGRPSRLQLHAKGTLADARPETATGALELEAEWATPQREVLATVSAAVSATQGALAVPRVSAVLPGVRLTAKGDATRQTVALTGRLELQDLSRLSTAVHEFTGQVLPALRGHGALDVVVKGPLTHPGVWAKGRFAPLSVPQASMDALDLDLTLVDVLRPFDADGTLRARRLTLGGSTFDAVTAALVTKGRAVEVTLTTQGLGDLRLGIAGLLDADQAGLAVSGLTLASTEGEWALEAPTSLAWRSGELVLAPLALRSGGQRLTGEARKTATTLQAAVGLTQVRLDRLPRALVPASLGLAGTVSGTVTASGKLKSPTARLTLEWQDGALQGLRPLSATVDAGWAANRLSGTLLAQGPVGTVHGRFDVPVLAVLDRQPEPLSAHLEVRDVEAAAVGRALERTLPADGRLEGTVELAGTGDAPTLTVVVKSPALDVQVPLADGPVTLKLQSPALEVATAADGTLGLRATLQVLGAEVVLAVATPLTVAGLRAHRPTADEARALELDGTLEVTHLNLARLHEAGLVAQESLVGEAGLTAKVKGSLAAPRLVATVTGRGITAGGLTQLGLDATLKADDTSTTVSGDATLNQRPLASVQARVAAPLASLADQATLGSRALALQATLSPVDLRALLGTTAQEDATRGTVTASATLTGTLDAPEVTVKAEVADLALARVALGSARLHLAGDGQAQTVKVLVGPPGRDDFDLHGTVKAPLTLARLRHGVSASDVPLALSLDSRELDVGFLSGVSQVLRVVGGKLTMRAEVAGTAAAPDVHGDVHWKNGRLSVMGYGDYRDIALDAQVTRTSVEVPRFTLRAGSGKAAMKGRADRQASGAWRLGLEGTTERLPVINDDQLMALVTMKLSAQGDVTPEAVDLTDLSLSRVEVELPDVKRKDLQDLDRPPDIVLVRASTRRQGPAVGARADEAPGRVYRARLNAPRNLWVKSSDVNMELGLSEGFRFEYAGKPQMFGDANILFGKLSVIGREFEVQKGSQVRFAGPATQPWISVQALYTNEREKQVTKVTVVVTGRGKDIALKVSSDPPMPESDIYTLLATGRRELRRGGGATITTEQAVSALTSVAASALKSVLAKKLPIDVLNFEAADNFQGVSDLKFDVGKYLSDSLFLGFSILPGARAEKGESQYAGRLELQLSRRWSVEAWAGTAPAGGSDFVWTADW